MDNILDNVVFLVKSIKKRKVESGYTYGEIILSDSLIEKITDLNDNNLIVVYNIFSELTPRTSLLFFRKKFIEIVTEKSCAKIENRTELCR